MYFRLFAALLVIVSVVALVIHAGRTRALFELHVRKGKTTLKRGRIPPALFEALSDVMRSARVERAQLRVIREQGAARVEGSGLSEGTLQRARNVVGMYPLARIVNAPGPRKTR